MGIGPARYILVAPRTINKFEITSWFKKKCMVRDRFRNINRGNSKEFGFFSYAFLEGALEMGAPPPTI